MKDEEKQRQEIQDDKKYVQLSIFDFIDDEQKDLNEKKEEISNE